MAAMNFPGSEGQYLTVKTFGCSENTLYTHVVNVGEKYVVGDESCNPGDE